MGWDKLGFEFHREIFIRFFCDIRYTTMYRDNLFTRKYEPGDSMREVVCRTEDWENTSASFSGEVRRSLGDIQT